MSDTARLENYLARLDRMLAPISISERAEILIEIKSHILEAQSRSGSLDSALQSMGEPEAVAKRYLSERGLESIPATGSTGSSLLKWFVIGSLGLVALMLLTFGVLVWKFTPLVAVDEKTQKVQILGGLITVDGDGNALKLRGQPLGGGNQRKFGGERSVDPKKTKILKIEFTNGKVEFKPSASARLKWNCAVGGAASDQAEEFQEEGPAIRLNLSRSLGQKCEFEVPPGIAIDVTGVNGKIGLEGLAAAIAINAMNAEVQFKPAFGKLYQFDIRVAQGKIDQRLQSSQEPSAYPVNIRLQTGKVSLEE